MWLGPYFSLFPPSSPGYFLGVSIFSLANVCAALKVGFDVPGNSVQTYCALRLTIPAPTPWGYPNTVTGTGRLDVHGVIGLVDPGTTSWNNRPTRYPDTPIWTVSVCFLSFSPFLAWARAGRAGADKGGYTQQPLTFGDAVITGPAIPCNRGQRMDFEVLADRPGATYFDFYGMTSPSLYLPTPSGAWS